MRYLIVTDEQSPFAGLFTVPKLAIELDRYGIGFELNPVSFIDGVHYCQAAEQEKNTPTLFDLMEFEAKEKEVA